MKAITHQRIPKVPYVDRVANGRQRENAVAEGWVERWVERQVRTSSAIPDANPPPHSILRDHAAADSDIDVRI